MTDCILSSLFTVLRKRIVTTHSSHLSNCVAHFRRSDYQEINVGNIFRTLMSDCFENSDEAVLGPIYL